jgi:translation initiation factor 3 subunit E
MSDSKVGNAQNHDLTQSLIPFLDPHMVLPLLDHLLEKKLYPEEDVRVAKLQLVMKTNLVDTAMDELKSLCPDAAESAELKEKKKSLLQSLHTLKVAVQPLLNKILGENCDPASQDAGELINVIKRDFDRRGSSLNCSPQDLKQLHDYAKVRFKIGHYKDALICLTIFRSLNKEEESNFQALWGTLASEILQVGTPSDLKRALDVLEELQKNIDERMKTDQLMQLQQRSWLIHWSLFLYLKMKPSPDSYSALIKFMTADQKIVNTIQTTCPHILRYLTVAAVCQSQKRRKVLDDVIAILEVEEFRDPVTSFVMALLHEFDMEAARQNLTEAEALFDSDFFLSLSAVNGRNTLKTDFMECARRLLFEIYCKTHARIDLALLARNLNVTEEEATEEKVSAQIARFIREVGLNAKIDSKSNQLVMESQPSSAYQRVISKTKNLEDKSAQMLENLKGRQ